MEMEIKVNSRREDMKRSELLDEQGQDHESVPEFDEYGTALNDL
jgi:hypothetical protein